MAQTDSSPMLPLTTLRLGDCLEVLAELPDECVDAVVTDPPYGLGKEPDATAMLMDWLTSGHHDVKGSGFMGKHWDAFVPQPALWREVLRVLKPGGHVLCFAGTRTYDLMALGLRLAGFEIRDCVMWVYGQGFPKSADISKQIDKAAGAEREVVGVHVQSKQDRKPGSVLKGSQDASLAWQHDITAPATPEAQQWAGWGTALKPAVEPCVLARKPVEGTVAANVLTHGTGGLNIDGCRVEGPMDGYWGGKQASSIGFGGTTPNGYATQQHPQGRWPANLTHDGSDEVVELFPEVGGGKFSKSGGRNLSGPSRSFGSFDQSVKNAPDNYGDSGSAARFFYCAKASKKERGSDNTHPTVKPLALMRYLVKLITPPDGVVLDPFMGSGTTGIACQEEGFRFYGIEREPEYFDIAERRIHGEEESLPAELQGLLLPRAEPPVEPPAAAVEPPERVQLSLLPEAVPEAAPAAVDPVHTALLARLARGRARAGG